MISLPALYPNPHDNRERELKSLEIVFEGKCEFYDIHGAFARVLLQVELQLTRSFHRPIPSRSYPPDSEIPCTREWTARGDSSRQRFESYISIRYRL